MKRGVWVIWMIKVIDYLQSGFKEGVDHIGSVAVGL